MRYGVGDESEDNDAGKGLRYLVGDENGDGGIVVVILSTFVAERQASSLTP